jgi:hypothetical protein
MNADHIVQAFIARINAHDADAIAAALTADHVFIDSRGTRITGREVMREGWRAYLRRVPDYRLSAAKLFSDGAEVVVIGQAQGTWSADGSLHAHNARGHPCGVPRAGARRSHYPLAGLCRQRADPALHAATRLIRVAERCGRLRLQTEACAFADSTPCGNACKVFPHAVRLYGPA